MLIDRGKGKDLLNKKNKPKEKGGKGKHPNSFPSAAFIKV